MIPSILSRQLVVGVKDFLITTFHSTTLMNFYRGEYEMTSELQR